MDTYNKLLNTLESLELNQVRNNIGPYIDLINSGEKGFTEVLYELLQLELKAQDERAINACVKVANFPFIKTLDDFDFTFQPSVNRKAMIDLETLRFIENKENVLFVGSSGVGKTHLATAIGIAAAKKRYSTYFVTFESLMTQLKKALDENRLEKRMKFFARYKVLIIDELGYLPVDKDASNLFFQLIAKRYEKHCTIITTNQPFTKWAEILGSPVLANAVLDRLLHHSHVISIKGPSYRMREKQCYLSENEEL